MRLRLTALHQELQECVQEYRPPPLPPLLATTGRFATRVGRDPATAYNSRQLITKWTLDLRKSLPSPKLRTLNVADALS